MVILADHQQQLGRMLPFPILGIHMPSGCPKGRLIGFSRRAGAQSCHFGDERIQHLQQLGSEGGGAPIVGELDEIEAGGC